MELRNWFVQMLNAIPGQILAVLNVVYFAQTVTDRFAYVKEAQGRVDRYWPSMRSRLYIT